jgi:hypothetical protein
VKTARAAWPVKPACGRGRGRAGEAVLSGGAASGRASNGAGGRGIPAGPRLGKGVAQKSCAPATSPPAALMSLANVPINMVWFMKRTLPSHSSTFMPPEWKA